MISRRMQPADVPRGDYYTSLYLSKLYRARSECTRELEESTKHDNVHRFSSRNVARRYFKKKEKKRRRTPASSCAVLSKRRSMLLKGLILA